MRSLKLGILSLALVGAAAAVPQTAHAVASFSVSSEMIMGVRYNAVGYTGMSGRLAPQAGAGVDGTYTGGGQVATTVRTSAIAGFGTGTIRTTPGSYDAFTSTLVNVGDTDVGLDITRLTVAPSYTGIPQPFTNLAYVGLEVSGSADGANGDSQLWGGAYNTNITTTFRNSTASTQSIDVAFLFNIDPSLDLENAGSDSGFAGGTFQASQRSRTGVTGSSGYSAWSNVFTESFYNAPEFGLNQSTEEALRFITITLAPNTTTQINMLLAAEGNVVSQQVPVPAALPLLGLGVGGLGFMGWRRRKAA